MRNFTQLFVSNQSTTRSLLSLIVLFLFSFTTNVSAQCSCPDNIITNGSFESNTTGWQSSTSFYDGNGFQQCGTSRNAFLDATINSGWVWQQKDATPGFSYTLSVYAGTHETWPDHRVRLAFYDSSGNYIDSDSEQVDYDVDGQGGDLGLYVLTMLAPSNASKVAFEAYAEDDFLKMDEICLTGYDTDMQFGCSDGQKVEITGTGSGNCNNNPDITVGISDPNQVTQNVVEVDFKTEDPGDFATVWDNNGNEYVLAHVFSGYSKVYRGVLPGNISSVSINNENGTCGDGDGLQSMVIFSTRNSSSNTAQSVFYTDLSSYCDIETFTMDIPTDSGNRNVTVTLPLSEMTNDGRYLTIEVTANSGGATGSTTIYGSDTDLDICCLNIVTVDILNVAGNASSLTIRVLTDGANNPSGSACGQSYTLAGAVCADVDCDSCDNVTDAGEISGNQIACGNSYDPSNITSLEAPSGGAGAIEYVWLKYEGSAPPANASNASTISGATSSTYNPSSINTTTWYRRCARRAGCESYSGETNWVGVILESGCTICTTRDLTDALQCGGGIMASFWADSNDFLTSPSNFGNNWEQEGAGTFVEYDNGDTRFLITVKNVVDPDLKFAMDIMLTGKTNSGSPVEPYCGNPFDDSDWIYYSGFSGTLTGYGDIRGGEISITGHKAPHTPQQGTGANLHSLGYGFSSWAEYSVISEPTDTDYNLHHNAGMDFNFDLSGDAQSCNMCDNVTNGGTISEDQSFCGTSGDPDMFQNVTSPSGGSGALQYIWLSTTDLSIPVQDWAEISGATSPTYNAGVVTQDTWFIRCARREGCDVYEGESNILYISFNPIPDLDAGQNVDICDGQSVTLTVNATGGTSPYTYSWPNGLGGGNSKTVTPSGTTTYVVTVSDDNGCESTDDVTVNVNPNPTAQGNDSEICEGSQGSVSVTPSGGQSPYEYIWSNGGTSQTISGLSPSTTTVYTVTVIDDNGCSTTASATLTVNPNPELDLGNDATICEGESYTINASATSGTAPYTYTLDGANMPNGTATVSPNQMTTYTVDVTDDNGCTTSDQITISVSNNPIALITGPATICAGEDVQFVAGNAGSGVTYSWTFENGTPSTADGSSAIVQWGTVGNHEVTLTVSKDGCSSTATTNIDITQEVLAIAGPDASICSGGDVVLDGGGTPGGNYTWTVESGDPTSIDGGANTENVAVSPLSTTVYKLVVTQNGCSRTDFVTVTIDVNKNPTADAGDDKNECEQQSFVLGGSPTGTPPANDPTANLGYIWSPSANLDNASIANPTATINTPGSYDFEVIVYSLNTGCSDTSSVTINVNSKPAVDAGDDTAICDGDSYTIVPAASGGQSPYTFFLDGEEMIGGQSTVSPTEETTYTVLGVDAFGCENTDDITISITSNPIATITGPSTICAGEDVQFVAGNAGSGATYAWTFENGSPASSNGASAIVQWNSIGDYDITLTVTKDGCSTSTSTNIIITQEVIAIAGPDVSICSGGDVILDGGGTPGGNYTWTVESGDPTSIDNGANSEDVAVSPLSTTVYKLVVTQNGCSRTDFVTVTIDVNKNPTADAGDDKQECEGEDFILGGNPTGTPPVDDPTTGLGYIWSPSGDLNDATIANPTASISQPGDYNFTVIVYSLNTGCSDTSSVTITIEDKATVGNYTWLDTNYNGVQEGGEQGVNGVSVAIYDANTDVEVDATTTISNGGSAGYYQFEVCKGDYYIIFGESNNTIRTLKDATSDTQDSDADESTGRTDDFNLAAGESNQTIDAGYSSVADLELEKTVSDNAPNVGDVVTYTITISNQGPSDATGVAAEDIIPNGLSNITNISNGGSMTGGVINWFGMSIANGSSVTLTYNATVEAPVGGVSYENVAQVTGSDQFDVDSTPDNDDGDQSEDDEDPETITPEVVDLELEKTVSDNTPNVGDVVTYTITISNQGPSDATGVAAEDIIPNGLSNITNISNGGSMTGGVIN